MLWRYRQAVSRTGETHLGALTALVGVGTSSSGQSSEWPHFRWALRSRRSRCSSRPAVSIAVGAVVLIAGALQFSAGKARHLACCREAPGRGRTLPADARTVWRHGLHWNCCQLDLCFSSGLTQPPNTCSVAFSQCRYGATFSEPQIQRGREREPPR